MFLFLSKLLPQFIYPLGLVCLLLVLALVLLWKKPRWTALPISLALVILLVSSNGWAAFALITGLEWQYLPQGDLPRADAIVVLGGGTRPALPPRPWVEVDEAGSRVLYAAKLYREGKAPRMILSGGRIDWVDKGISQPGESADMAAILELMGVPATAILQDPDSLNTYENAVNVKKILQAQEIKRVLLVTSAMHMPRSMLIFKRLGIEAIAAPTDFRMVQPGNIKEEQSLAALLLNVTPDAYRLKDISRALKEYLGLLVYRLKGWA